jgi:hypothetical protein
MRGVGKHCIRGDDSLLYPRAPDVRIMPLENRIKFELQDLNLDGYTELHFEDEIENGLSPSANISRRKSNSLR